MKPKIKRAVQAILHSKNHPWKAPIENTLEVRMEKQKRLQAARRFVKKQLRIN